ncbi:LAMI_0H20032g1_1 [Lachancea mirantina]|uniref:Methylated-DNA--protein-cysteine methyltransferase n=1 Tax=Lachancea mirantina TaxID=1230905 RepID=A0A1G4KKD7_9SACH|nr:LAMI_0H20032g1_1 [Lachancea mirantina]
MAEHLAYTFGDFEDLSTILISRPGDGHIVYAAFGEDKSVLLCEAENAFANLAEKSKKRYILQERKGGQSVDYVGQVLEKRFPAPQVEFIFGTDFQRQVWKQLMNIDSGSTTTYKAIAEVLGMPTASRAVANACAQNKIALFVPCHRVLRTNGDLGGYRWSLPLKRNLLNLEKIKTPLSASD